MNVEYMKMYRSDMNFTVTDLELLNHEDKMASEIINEGVIRPVITSRAIEKPAINDQSPRRMRKVVPRRELKQSNHFHPWRRITGCIVFPIKNPKINATNITVYANLSNVAKKSTGLFVNCSCGII